jgi:hypothetical protein
LTEPGGTQGSSGPPPDPTQPRWQPFADAPGATPPTTPPETPSPALPDESTLTPSPNLDDVDEGSIVPDQLHDAPAYVPPAIGMTPGTILPPTDPSEVPSSAWITTASEVAKPAGMRSGIQTAIAIVIGVVVVAFLAYTGLTGRPSNAGKVLFGTSPGSDLCTVGNAATTIKATDNVYFSAILKHKMDGNQAITLHITKEGKELVNYEEPADGTSFDCYGNRDSLSPLEPGQYRFEVIHNGEVEATGDLTIT